MEISHVWNEQNKQEKKQYTNNNNELNMTKLSYYDLIESDKISTTDWAYVRNK